MDTTFPWKYDFVVVNPPPTVGDRVNNMRRKFYFSHTKKPKHIHTVNWNTWPSNYQTFTLIIWLKSNLHLKWCLSLWFEMTFTIWHNTTILHDKVQLKNIVTKSDKTPHWNKITMMPGCGIFLQLINKRCSQLIKGFSTLWHYIHGFYFGNDWRISWQLV